MFYNATYKNTIESINWALAANIDTLIIPVTNYSLSILNRLVDFGVLRSVKLIAGTVYPRMAFITITTVCGYVTTEYLYNIAGETSRCHVNSTVLQKTAGQFNGRLVIMTTTLGILSIEEARMKRVGGFVLFEVIR